MYKQMDVARSSSILAYSAAYTVSALEKTDGEVRIGLIYPSMLCLAF